MLDKVIDQIASDQVALPKLAELRTYEQHNPM